MPLLDRPVEQLVFAFVMIGLFGLILRWTFSRGRRDQHTVAGGDPTAGTGSVSRARRDPPEGGSPESGSPDGRDQEGRDKDARQGTDAREISVYPDGPTPVVAAEPEDYGLLVAAATVDTAQQATQLRMLLRQGRIRATTAIGADGRRRVLVFSRDLERARRLIARHPQ